MTPRRVFGRGGLPSPVRMNAPASGHPVKCSCEACYGPGGHIRLSLNMNGGGGGGNGGTDHYVATRIVAPTSGANPGGAAGRSTDPNIAAAIAALAGKPGSIYLLEGTHAVAGPLALPDNSILVGAGRSGPIVCAAAASPGKSVV